MKAPFKNLASAVGDNIQGQLDAQRFIERLRGTYADPDDLLRQVLLAREWSEDRLRGLCRRIQKEIERGGGDA